MESMNLTVASNIKRLRDERNISLDELSRLSGVSKSMIAQIERGEGNPTISTLWKISNGMKVPFDELTKRKEDEYEIVKLSDILPLHEDNDKVANYPIFPDDGNRRFSVYILNLEENCYFKAEPHLKGTEEYITVFEGELEVTSGPHTFQIKKDESLRFKADCNHSYKNIGKGNVVLHMIIRNP